MEAVESGKVGSGVVGGVDPVTGSMEMAVVQTKTELLGTSGDVEGGEASSAAAVSAAKEEESLGGNVSIQYDEKGQKSYKCEICDKVLQSKYNLKRHNVSGFVTGNQRQRNLLSSKVLKSVSQLRMPNFLISF